MALQPAHPIPDGHRRRHVLPEGPESVAGRQDAQQVAGPSELAIRDQHAVLPSGVHQLERMRHGRGAGAHREHGAVLHDVRCSGAFGAPDHLAVRARAAEGAGEVHGRQDAAEAADLILHHLVTDDQMSEVGLVIGVLAQEPGGLRERRRRRHGQGFEDVARAAVRLGPQPLADAASWLNMIGKGMEDVVLCQRAHQLAVAVDHGRRGAVVQDHEVHGVAQRGLAAANDRAAAAYHVADGLQDGRLGSRRCAAAHMAPLRRQLGQRTLHAGRARRLGHKHDAHHLGGRASGGR
mmetsp:Transcript_95670/g.275679  ORF Transcript_95670/g.275679 Transcript_95670/m.275679 type:complete len:293 (-) Transcript_95670:66-944(-)